MDENKIKIKKEQGKRLRIARSSLSLTQGGFGKPCGLSWSKIKDRERGVVKISGLEAKAFQQEYGFNSEWLLNGQGEIKSMPQRKDKDNRWDIFIGSPKKNEIKEEGGHSWPVEQQADSNSQVALADVIHDVTDIMTSGNEGIISALTKNVREFKLAVATAKRLTVGEEELRVVRDEIDDLRKKVDYLTKEREGSEPGDS